MHMIAGPAYQANVAAAVDATCKQVCVCVCVNLLFYV
jgi:hypothetical protein